MNPPSQIEKITFDSFEVNLKTEELWRGARKVRCQRQPFRVLKSLLAQPGEVVSREQLRLAVWGADSPADADHSLGIAMNKLREALGDSAEEPRFIETLSRRGYRFIAPVAVASRYEPEPASLPAVSIGPPALPAASPAELLPASSLPASLGSPISVRAELPVVPAATSWGVSSEPRPGKRRLHPRAILALGALVLLGVFTGLGLAFWFSAATAPPHRIDQLTHNDSIFPGVPSMESFPVLASDGARLYSSILDNGQTEIASIDATSGEMQQLQLPSEIVNPTLGDISPDGTRLLVRSHPSSQSEQPVWVVPRAGGSALRVGSILAQDAVWMPDGQSVLYAAGNNLNILRLSDGQVTQFGSLPGRPFWMRWSPNGRLLRLTLLNPLSHTSSLWQIDRGGQATPLLAGWTMPASECCGVWTADGKAFVFASGHDGGSDLWALRGNSTSGLRKLTNGPLRYTAPMVEHDSSLIYFVGLDVRSELQRYDSSVARFVPERGFLASASRVSYSRDRRWVAWTGEGGRLWRARSADPVAPAPGASQPAAAVQGGGAEKVQLTADKLEVFLANWSPDGQSLVTMAREPGQAWQLFLVHASGGAPERLLHEARNEADPTWSNDGRHIAFGRIPDLMGRENGPKQIEILDLATRKVEPLPGSEGLFSPRWSPDGRWIAALTLGEQRLMLFDTTTRTWRALGNLQVADPVWSADGSSLFVHSVFTRPQAIEKIAVPSGAPSIVANLASPLVSDKADYVFVGLSREEAPLVRVRTATGNLYSLALGK